MPLDDSLMPNGKDNPVVASRRLTLKQAMFIAKGSHEWDALAYDQISQSPATKVTPELVRQDRLRNVAGRIPLRGNRETLLSAKTCKCSSAATCTHGKTVATGNPPVGSSIPVETRHMRFLFTGGREGDPHPEFNRREWLDANSVGNMLLPTAANDICFKCGYRDCHCHAVAHNPATCQCDYHLMLRSDAERHKAVALFATVIPRAAKGAMTLFDRAKIGNRGASRHV